MDFWGGWCAKTVGRIDWLSTFCTSLRGTTPLELQPLSLVLPLYEKYSFQSRSGVAVTLEERFEITDLLILAQAPRVLQASITFPELQIYQSRSWVTLLPCNAGPIHLPKPFS